MIHRAIGFAGILGAVASLAVAASMAITGDFGPVEDGPPDSGDAPGRKSCGRWCYGVWVEAGTCTNNQFCCGWVNCANGNSQNVCYATRPACRDGLHTDPPSTPHCVYNP